jgi:hypothetical protein
MVPDLAPLLAVIAVLFSLAYFAMASFPFLLVRLDIPEVWRLFRGLFDFYFKMVGIVGVLAAIAFTTNDHLVFSAAMLILGGVAITARQRVLQRMDTLHETYHSVGGAAAMRELRVIHGGTMLINVAVLAFVASCLPYIMI